MWDWALAMSGFTSAMSLTVAWLAGRKRISAWTFGLVNQAVWVGYALVTGHWPFIVTAAAFTVIYIRNIVLWRRAAPDVPPPPSA